MKRSLTIACALLTATVFCTRVAHADFDIQDFSVSTDHTLAGNAALTGNGLAVDLTLAITDQNGAVWSTLPQDVSGDFTATFNYRVLSGPGADGMAFVIQTVGPNQVSTGQGGFLGYNGITGALAVELDMYNNSGFGDPNGNHISLHRNGDVMATGEIATAANVPPINTPGPHDVTIEYVGGTLNVYFDSTTPVLSAPLDVAMEVGGSMAHIGITAATGGLVQNHRLRTFTFTSGAGGGPQFTRGDCDDSGSVNLADAVWLLGFLFPTTTPNVLACESACDSNDDGSLNLVDAVALLNSLFGSPVIPLPGPSSCGVDPTTDMLLCTMPTACP